MDRVRDGTDSQREGGIEEGRDKGRRGEDTGVFMPLLIFTNKYIFVAQATFAQASDFYSTGKTEIRSYYQLLQIN